MAHVKRVACVMQKELLIGQLVYEYIGQRWYFNFVTGDVFPRKVANESH